MSDINLNAMDRNELVEQAELLGVEFSGRESADSIRGKLADALGIDLGDAAVPTKKASTRKAAEPKGKKEKRYKLTIATSESDDKPVPVTINGYTYTIPRGVEVEVPEAVIEVLKNAVGQKLDPKTKEWREVLSYPFSASPI